MRRLWRTFWRWAPPVGVVLWAFHVYRVARGYVFPAFGNVEAHLVEYRGTLLGQLPLGVILAALWVLAWVWLAQTGPKPSPGALKKGPVGRSSMTSSE